MSAISKICNCANNNLELVDILLNFSFSTNKKESDCY